MSKSFDLGPPSERPLSLFLQSQFRSPVQWPPKDTHLEGKAAIVTGATSGLGLEASQQLLSFGLSSLIIAVRSPDKGEQVAITFRNQFPKATIQVWSLEMESYDSIRSFAHRADTELSRMDIVILNAGLQLGHFQTVPSTGHEKLIQVNYLSTMLLAILMLPILKVKSPPNEPGRLSIINSGTARGAKLSIPEGSHVLPALDDPRSFNAIERYAVSKMLAHLFMINLVRYVRAEDVVVNLVDPGMVKDTALQRFAPWPVAAFFYCFKGAMGRTLSVGASTYLDGAIIKGEESHGCYVANWKISA
jgi:NAD(P)-dependent dehydrogenase (short-subunit alcohol dehydrogenase family)